MMLIDAIKYLMIAIFGFHFVAAVMIAGWRGAASCLIKTVIDLPMMLLGLVVVPIALLFRTPDDHLPKWAWLWDNERHGTDGDSFWISRCGDTFWCRFQWLALRNPTGNLGTNVLSIITKQGYTLDGDLRIGDKIASGKYLIKSGWAWECYKIGTPYQLWKRSSYPWLNKRRALRARIGWKIHGTSIGDRCTFVFVINPLMPYSGV